MVAERFFNAENAENTERKKGVKIGTLAFIKRTFALSQTFRDYAPPFDEHPHSVRG